MVPQRNMTHHIQCERMLPLPLSGKVQSFFSSKQDKDVFKWVNRTVLPVILKDDGTARSVIRPMGGHRVDLIVAGAAVPSSVLLCLQQNEQLAQPPPPTHQGPSVKTSRPLNGLDVSPYCPAFCPVTAHSVIKMTGLMTGCPPVALITARQCPCCPVVF